MPPVGPHYQPEPRAEMKLNDLLQRRQPATLATWIVGIVLVVAVLVWITLLVSRSHRTSVMPPDAVSARAGVPRSAVPAR
jgi:hypothetical protein